MSLVHFCLSSPFTSSFFPVYPLYHHFSSICPSWPPVGIGKRCSSLPAWPLPSHGHQSVIPKPLTACPLVSQSTSSKHEAPHVITVVHKLRCNSQSVKASQNNHSLSSLERRCSQTALPVPKHVVWAWDMTDNLVHSSFGSPLIFHKETERWVASFL